MSFIPQQGAGAYIPEGMLNQPVQQPAGYANPTGITAYQPDFNQFYSPGSMLQQPVQIPSFTGGMFAPSPGGNVQSGTNAFQGSVAQDEAARSAAAQQFLSAMGGNK